MRKDNTSQNNDSNLVFNKHDIHKKTSKNESQVGNLQFEQKTNYRAKKDTTRTGNLKYTKKKPQKIKEEKPKKPKEPKPKMTIGQKIGYGFKLTFFSLLGLGLSGLIILSIIIGNWIKDTPELDTTLLTNISQSSIIYDAQGVPIANYSSYENREWVTIDEIPQWIKDAIVSVEDHRFYSHPGIDFKRFVGAVLGQLTGQDDYGGSTLTQQLIKNVYLTSEVTYKRKAQEIYLALQLERKMSKDEILEAYLNIIYLGGSNYGIKAAAKDYFGKDLDELTLRECAMIAGLTKNPNGYNPRKNMQKGDMSPTNDRTDTVLYTMHLYGKISDEEYQQALENDVTISEQRSYSETYPYPHYVEYVLNEVAKDLLIQEGKEVTNQNLIYKKYAIRNGGYQIYTTLNQSMQQTLQNTAANFDEYPQTEDEKGVEVSAVIMDQRTGEIIAMIGSKNEPTALETFNRASDSTQPVGSILKPIGIFAPALENNLAPASLIADYQSGIKGYDLSNGYPGGTCSSRPMTMREAIENSHNIPAARFLIDHVGLNVSEEYLLRLGISKDHIQENSAGIVLGTSGITMVEMTGAYATLANDGMFIEPHAYSVVLDRHGKEILNAEKNSTKRRVFSESTAWLTTDMMISEIENGGGYNAKIEGITAAGKTGTHEDRCITFAGYTGYYTSVLRISSDTYSAMYDASGGEQAAKLWQAYMSLIHEGLEDKPIQGKTAEELGILQAEVCDISGELATDLCRNTGHAHTDYYTQQSVPSTYCQMHKLVCSESGLLANDECIEEGDYYVATLIPSTNYLYDVDHDLLESTLDNVRFRNITEYCDDHDSYKPVVIPTPEPEEPEEPEDPVVVPPPPTDTPTPEPTPEDTPPSEPSETPPEETPPEETPTDTPPEEPTDSSDESTPTQQSETSETPSPETP